MMVLNGVLTPAGTNYLNEWSPIAYLQELAGNPTWSLTVNGGVARTGATYNLNGDVLDSSGNGNNAMLAGTHTFAGAAGNQVLQFDGVHDYVVVPPNVGEAANFTFAAWVNWGGGALWQRIFDFGLDDNKYLFLSPSSGSSTLRFAITTSAGGNGANEQRLDAAPLTPGVWTHVAVTINGSTAKLFTNGVLAATSTTFTINPASIPQIYCWLGKSQYFPDPLFQGALADVVIQGSAMTDAQVASLATTPPTVNISAPAAPTGLSATAVSSSQVNLAWTGSSGANSYNVKRATTSGGPYSAIAQGITATSYSDTLGNAGTTYYYVVSAMNGSGESANSAQASATTAAGVPAAPTDVTAHSGSYQVSLTWIASQSPGADSYNIKRATTSGGPYTTIATGVSAPTSGTYVDHNTVVGTYYYVISGVNAYGESVNSAEVSGTIRNLVDYWKFDDGSGTTALDSAGANNGTLGTGSSWVTGVSNGAVHLDGTAGAAVTMPAGIVSQLTDFSIAAWVNLSASNAWQRIFDFGSGTGTYMFLTPEAGGGGPLRFAITTGGGGGEQQISGPAPLTTGVWHHVAVTLSNTIGVLYLDGVAVATNSNITLEPMNLGSTTQNTIGQSQYADPHLTGTVDEFRIYGRALSAAEVAAFASGGPALPAAPTGLSATGGNAVVNLGWTQSTSPGITQNNVYRSTSGSGGPYSLLTSLAATTAYADTAVVNGSTYYYSVSAVNANGESALSPYAGATPNTVPNAPSNLTATAGRKKITLGWTDNSSNETGFSIERSTDNVTFGQIATVAANSTVYTNSSLTTGATYYYRVQAYNSAGNSPYSNTASATSK